MRTTSSATTTATSAQSTISSSSLASKVSDHNRRMDNFDDYETILRRTSEVEAFLTEVSASKSVLY
jgi:hypothetical protein